MKRAYSIIIGIGLCIILLSIVQIALSNMLSTGGIQIAQMQQELTLYQNENLQMKEQLYTLSSLTHISQEAQKMGFVTDNNTAFVLDHPAPLAIKP